MSDKYRGKTHSAQSLSPNQSGKKKGEKKSKGKICCSFFFSIFWEIEVMKRWKCCVYKCPLSLSLGVFQSVWPLENLRRKRNYDKNVSFFPFLLASLKHTVVVISFGQRSDETKRYSRLRLTSLGPISQIFYAFVNKHHPEIERKREQFDHLCPLEKEVIEISLSSLS